MDVQKSVQVDPDTMPIAITNQGKYPIALKGIEILPCRFHPSLAIFPSPTPTTFPPVTLSTYFRIHEFSSGDQQVYPCDEMPVHRCEYSH
jgi:hypothetical protein